MNWQVENRAMYTDQFLHEKTPSSFLQQIFLQIMRFLVMQTGATYPTPLALLIDGDNISPALITQILAETSKVGYLAIRRIYGNWGNANMQRWREVSVHYALEQRHHGQVAAGKNATDIALVIDAMDIFYSGQIQHFCLVTSDSDYTPLVLRLRKAGCIVFGICDPQKAPAALVKAFSMVLMTEQMSTAHSGSKPTSTEPMPDNVTPLASKQVKQQEEVQGQQHEQLIELLERAYEKALQEGKGEWILCSSLGNILRQLEPDFKPKQYGHKGLNALFNSTKCKKYFETRIIERGNQLEIRRKAENGERMMPQEVQ
jgi:NYN domain/OST-HTH/LOTUS domain